MRAKTANAQLDDSEQALMRVRIREQAKRIDPFLKRCNRILTFALAIKAIEFGKPATLHIDHQHWCDYFKRDPEEGFTCTCIPDIWAES